MATRTVKPQIHRIQHKVNAALPRIRTAASQLMRNRQIALERQLQGAGQALKGLVMASPPAMALQGYRELQQFHTDFREEGFSTALERNFDRGMQRNAAIGDAVLGISPQYQAAMVIGGAKDFEEAWGDWNEALGAAVVDVAVAKGAGTVASRGATTARAGTQAATRGAPKAAPATSAARSPAPEAARWQVGDDIFRATARGEPSWTTVRTRYWKNQAAMPDAADIYGPENVARMQHGLAPQRYNAAKGSPRV